MTMLFLAFIIIIGILEEFAQITMRLCDEAFHITKYCLDLEIEILDIVSINCSC